MKPGMLSLGLCLSALLAVERPVKPSHCRDGNVVAVELEDVGAEILRPTRYFLLGESGNICTLKVKSYDDCLRAMDPSVCRMFYMRSEE